ncbi:MAG: ROK family protein [Bacteroidales bacterium]|nr:ROK family protein [Bacteroidales bacterium]
MAEIEINHPVVGVSLGGRTMLVGKVENGKNKKSIVKSISNKEREHVILGEIVDGIGEVFDESIAGIGIGVPGFVDEEQGIVYKVEKIPSWREVHLKEILENRFQVPVYVNNDANCFVVGEYYFGHAKEYENAVGLILSTGVGAGIIFKGHLYSGSNCGAGEFGSISYKDHDYEYYLSEGYFEEKYGVQADRLYSRAKKNDKIALAIFEQYGIDLGNAIKTILFAVDPEIIVIGGILSKAFPFFETSVWKTVSNFPYKNSLKKLMIVASVQENIAVFDAAALYLDAKKTFLKK